MHPVFWINGLFGVGKTQAAYALAQRLPGSFVCEPEQLGFAVRRMTPPQLRGDFQDVPLWRSGTRELLTRCALHGSSPVNVPMTLVNPAYFAETMGELRQSGIEVRHAALLASPETLRRRLRSRGEGSGSWGARQMERCLAGLLALDPADHLHTDGLTHTAVVEAIAEHFGLTLQPDTSSALQRR
ncbi:antibiotic resistance protein [Deinococcus proteolyticus MRP]|uniref:Antibiotic resistance protein n=1 Tax=Deinococcus proteolyticus (strain ATCC 35074 / DSM 20540 / JCM 6276 / NBRC 101906 / NCIMB 13154 / VKM Ac-1939 / CCM 2703 / MRP) TaxID=693977 RepID=F0RK24_DEIPM|nr:MULTISPECIES: AAA family ATPase [Deinococcus]ADY26670.1 antibiotic resistance protein [Deinococcus proteolyticus MRP]MCY1702798.1 AAA family ATPase [Deinococcus sp. SL84]